MPAATTRFLKNYASSATKLNPAAYTRALVDTLFPISNLMHPDRYVVASIFESYYVLVNIGTSATPITHLGVLNLDGGPNSVPSGFTFDYAPASPSFTVASCTTTSGGTAATTTGNFVTAGVLNGMMVTGPGVRAGTYVVGTPTAGSISLSQTTTGGTGTLSFYAFSGGYAVNWGALAGKPVDAVLDIGVGVAARWWRVNLGTVAGSGFALGNLLIGNVADDLGFAFSPGSGGRDVRTRVEAPGVAGMFVMDEPGFPHSEYDLKFRSVTQTTFNTLRAYAAVSPFILLGSDGRVAHADLTGPIEWEYEWGAPDLYHLTMPVRTLP